MKRRLPLIFVAVVTVACLAAASIAAVASGVSGSAVAYTVNGTKVSQSTVNDQLKELADRDAKSAVETLFQQSLATTDGAVDSNAAATWIDFQIRHELFRQAAADANVTVGAAERAAVAKTIEAQLESQQAKFRLADLPRSLRDAFVDSNAYQAALKLDTDAKLSAFLTKAFRTADVTVDPRYGRWNPRQGVCPPTGCAPANPNG
jgi:SurA N-terminal domain